MSDILLSVKEYARLFLKNEKAVYKRIQRGAFTRFPIERDGRSILIMVPSVLVQRLRKGQQQSSRVGSSPP